MNYSTPDMRRRYRQHFLNCQAIYKQQSESGLRLFTPSFPEDLRGWPVVQKLAVVRHVNAQTCICRGAVNFMG